MSNSCGIISLRNIPHIIHMPLKVPILFQLPTDHPRRVQAGVSPTHRTIHWSPGEISQNFRRLFNNLSLGVEPWTSGLDRSDETARVVIECMETVLRSEIVLLSK